MGSLSAIQLWSLKSLKIGDLSAIQMWSRSLKIDDLSALQMWSQKSQNRWLISHTNVVSKVSKYMTYQPYKCGLSKLKIGRIISHTNVVSQERWPISVIQMLFLKTEPPLTGRFMVKHVLPGISAAFKTGVSLLWFHSSTCSSFWVSGCVASFDERKGFSSWKSRGWSKNKVMYIGVGVSVYVLC